MHDFEFFIFCFFFIFFHVHSFGSMIRFRSVYYMGAIHSDEKRMKLHRANHMYKWVDKRVINKSQICILMMV